MKKKNLTFCLLMLLCLSTGISQTYYLSTVDNEIYRLEADNTLEYVFAVNGLQSQIFDIAISVNGTFYAMAGSKIIEIDASDGSFDILVSLPAEEVAYTSLVCNDQGELFYINNDSKELYKYVIADQTIELIDNLGYNTPGDLTFYKGNIIFPSYPYIRAYNLENSSLSDIHCLPEVNSLIWGIANDFSSCTSNRILASTASKEIWEINIEEDTISVLPINTLDLTIYGMASLNEYAAADCSAQLESISCPMSTNLNDLNNEIELSSSKSYLRSTPF